MTTETKIETATDAKPAIAAVEKKVEAPVATPASAVVAPVAATAPKAKPARRKAPAKVIEAVKQVNKRAAKAVRKAKVAPQAKAEPIQTEGYKAMNMDFTNWFAGAQLPGTDKFQALFAEAGEKGQEMVKKSQKAAEDMSDLTKANLEAMVEAGKIAVAGAKSIGQELIAAGREGIEEASTSVKTLAEAQSPTEFFQLQSELIKTSFDRMVAEGSKLTEQMVKLAGDAAKPLQNRASITAEKLNKLVA